MKSKRVCLGIGQADSLIHIENAYASGQKKRPRGPRSAPVVKFTGGLDVVLQRPLVDLNTKAIQYYLHHHLHTLDDGPNITKGLSDVCLPIWMSTAEGPILDLAVSSMALAVFSRTQQHPPAAIEASKKYHQLLQVAQVDIIHLNEINIGAYLLAIHFMSRYEDVVHCPSHLNLKTPFTTTCQSFSHHDGALAILKFWKDRLSHSQPATDVIKHTRRGMIKSALMRSLALPNWMRESASFGEYGLELEYDCIVVRIASLRQRLSMLLNEDPVLQGTSSDELLPSTEELNTEARDIDKALEDWNEHFPSTWSYQRHALSESHHHWPTDGLYSPMVYSYSSPAHAAAWNQYHTTRMLINSTRLKILQISRPSSHNFAYHEQRLKCLSQLNTMANDLASSVPFCLQRFKVTDRPDSSPFRHDSITLNTYEDIKPYVALSIIWPLTIASSLRNVDVDLQLWFRSELARLGRLAGFSVLECAETDRWLEL